MAIQSQALLLAGSGGAAVDGPSAQQCPPKPESMPWVVPKLWSNLADKTNFLHMEVTQETGFKSAVIRVVCALVFLIPAFSISFSLSTSRGLALLALIGVLARVKGWVPALSVPYI